MFFKEEELVPSKWVEIALRVTWAAVCLGKQFLCDKGRKQNKSVSYLCKHYAHVMPKGTKHSHTHYRLLLRQHQSQLLTCTHPRSKPQGSDNNIHLLLC